MQVRSLLRPFSYSLSTNSSLGYIVYFQLALFGVYMPAGSIERKAYPLILYHHAENVEDRDKPSHSRIRLPTTTLNEKAESLMRSLPQEILGAHLGIKDPILVRKLLPDSENLKIFRCGAKLYFSIVTAYHNDEELEWLSERDEIRYLFKTHRRVLKNEPEEPKPLPKDYSYIQRADQAHINTVMNSLFQHFAGWFQNQFNAVGVNSYDEFEKKSLFIIRARELAELQYLSTLENFERRKALDMTLFELYPIQQEDRLMVMDFWDQLLSTLEGPQIHQSFENQFKNLFILCLERINDVFGKLKGKLLPGFRSEVYFTHEGQPFDFPNELYKEIFSSVKCLVQTMQLDLSSVKTIDKKLARKYFFLKANITLTLLCKRMVRMKLEPMCDEIQNRKQQMTAQSLAQRQQILSPLISYWKNILELHDALINNTECDHPQFVEAKAAWSATPESERKLKVMNLDGTISEGVESVKETLQTIENLQKLTDEEYVRVDFAEEWLWSEGPQRYQNILEKAAKTTAESFFIDSYTIVYGNDVFNPESREVILQDIDMGCDLVGVGDPLDYFGTLIGERDDKRLALIPAQVASSPEF